MAIGLGTALPRAAYGRVFGANARLRIGLIGCGSRGNFLIEQALRVATTENVEIAALCDVWSVNLARTQASLARRQPGLAPRTFRRHAELLAMPDLDAVIIASPDFAHTPQLIDATKAGKDVYVEKPMATRLDHANEAVRLVHERRNVVQVGVQRRSDPRHRAGAVLVQSGILGTVSEVDAAWHDAAPRWARDHADVREADVDWEQYLMYLPREPFRAERFRRWHLYKDFTLGTPALLGAHLIDVGAWFMDDPLPAAAVALGGVYVWKDGREHADTLDCILEYPKGFILNYSTRLGNAAPRPEVVFHGTRGTFDTQSWTARGEGGGRDALEEPVTVPAVAAPMQAASASGGQPMNDPRLAGDEHMLDWLRAVRTRTAPTAPVDVGYQQTVASIMCFEALESGRRQRFDAATRTMRPG